MLVLRQKGYAVNHKEVLKLIKILKIYGKQRKGKYELYRGEVGKVFIIYLIESLILMFHILNLLQT